MKHELLIVFFLFATLPYAIAQDKLITKDGEVINAWNVDIGGSSIYYRSSNSKGATLKSIDKDKVLIIKKQDGTSVELYQQAIENNISNRQEDNSISNSGQSVPLSPENKQRNNEFISRINSLDPQYSKGNTDKDANRVLCMMGIGANSQLVNNDIEITPTIGHFFFDQGTKGDLAEKIQENVVNEKGGLKYYHEIWNYSSNPALAISIKNKTNHTIYIDLANTFFTRGENAMAYYVPSSSSSSHGSSSGGGVNLGAVAGALGVGGAVGTLASGVNVGGGNSNGTVNTTYSQRVIAIPPMSSKSLDPQLLFIKDGYLSKGLIIDSHYPKNWLPIFRFDKNMLKNGEKIKYEESESPLTFSFFVTYSASENFNQTQNAKLDFYLRELIGFPKGWGLYKGFNNYNVYIDLFFPDYSKGNTFFHFAGDIEKSKAESSFPLPSK